MAREHGTRRIEPPLPVSLDHTLDQLWRRGSDPCTGRDPDGSWWRTLRTPSGAATLRLAADDGGVSAEAWGPGAEQALELAPEIIGASDDITGFHPTGVLAEIHRRHPGARIVKTHAVWHATLLAVLEQKVAGKEALAAYVGICRAWSEPSPGPRPMLLPPAAEVIAELPYFELSRFGVERRRSETLRRLAARARELEALGLRDARAYLERFPGVGPWTSAEIARVALGDADALSVGDYNLPHLVAVNLTGEPRGDDAQMLALLAPYAGHRGRAQRLLEVGGRPAPRFGPRRRLRRWHR